MARPKIAHKTTNVDMTAMCDVAFLLLSFFILIAKFKPAEAIPVTTPTSVAAKVAPAKDLVMITINKEGKVFISMDDEPNKEYIANTLNNTKNLGINVKAFVKASFIGSSFGQLKAFLALPEDQRKGNLLPGIPVDTTKGANELNEWMRLINDSYQGKKMNLLLKGDNLAKYPSIKGVIDAFKKNDFLKFQMVTNPESVPLGSELWKNNQKGEKRED
jgi:biopolymer transport protein ExbD